MRQEDVQEIVDRELGPLARKLGIGHVPITVVYNPDEGTGGRMTAASCKRATRLGRAEITFYHERIEDGEKLREFLLHELLHVVMTPSAEFGEHVLRSLRNGGAYPIVEQLHLHAEEKLVCNLENLYYSLLTEHPGPGEDRPISAEESPQYLEDAIPEWLGRFLIERYDISLGKPLTGSILSCEYNQDNRSTIYLHPDYETATLRFNYEGLTTTRLLLESLRRELFRIVLEPYFNFAAHAVKAFKEEEGIAFFGSIRDEIEPRLVRALEAMYDGMCP